MNGQTDTYSRQVNLSPVRSFHYSFTVNADIDKVWAFYTDIGHLQTISPPAMQLRVVKSTHQQLVEGSEVWLAGILVTRNYWHSKITSLAPYQYVDEMITGRFKVWKHVHTFCKVDSNNTEVIDEIKFELRYGMIGRLFEGYVHSRLQQIFDYRRKTTVEALNH